MTPFFGVSLYIWSGILSTTLTFLAIGYYSGGRISKGRSTDTLLTLFMAAPVVAAAWIALASAAYPILFPLLSRGSLIVGSFFGATVLLALPLIVLSSMNPILIALARRRQETGDSGAGRVFFISTIGSVAGVIVAAFVLIPNFTNFRSQLYLGIAMSLLVLGMSWGQPRLSRRIKLRFAVGCLIAASLSTALVVWQQPYLKMVSRLAGGPMGTFNVVAEYLSVFGNLKVVDVYIPDDTAVPIRTLVQDGLIQNRATINHESMSMYTYVLEYLARSFEPGAQTALVLGMGGGIVPRNLKRAGLDVSVVEINEDSLHAAVDYFGFDARGMELFLEDARTFMRRCRRTFDVIIVDLFWGDNTPDYLLTLEFFKDLKRCLGRSGTMVMNAAFDDVDRRASRRLLATIGAAFPTVIEFGSPPGNTFVVAKLGPIPQDSGIEIFSVPAPLSDLVDAAVISGRVVVPNEILGIEPVTDNKNIFSILYANSNLRLRTHFSSQFPAHILLN